MKRKGRRPSVWSALGPAPAPTRTQAHQPQPASRVARITVISNLNDVLLASRYEAKIFLLFPKLGTALLSQPTV